MLGARVDFRPSFRQASFDGEEVALNKLVRHPCFYGFSGEVSQRMHTDE